MKTVRILTIIAIISFSINSFAQDKGDIVEYKFDISKVKDARALTYYGWDFRYLIFIDPKYPEPKDVAYNLLPELISILDDKCGSDYMKKNFLKPDFAYDPKSIQSLIKNVDEKKFVEAFRERLTIDTVRTIVKSYPLTGEGLGVVVIADEMRKFDKKVIAYVTIFSMETKDILYCCKIKGTAGGIGSVASFYGKGVTEIMSDFFDSYMGLFPWMNIKTR